MIAAAIKDSIQGDLVEGPAYVSFLYCEQRTGKLHNRLETTFVLDRWTTVAAHWHTTPHYNELASAGVEQYTLAKQNSPWTAAFLQKKVSLNTQLQIKHAVKPLRTMRIPWRVLVLVSTQWVGVTCFYVWGIVLFVFFFVLVFGSTGLLADWTLGYHCLVDCMTGWCCFRKIPIVLCVCF